MILLAAIVVVLAVAALLWWALADDTWRVEDDGEWVESPLYAMRKRDLK